MMVSTAFWRESYFSKTVGHYRLLAIALGRELADVRLTNDHFPPLLFISSNLYIFCILNAPQAVDEG